MGVDFSFDAVKKQEKGIVRVEDDSAHFDMRYWRFCQIFLDSYDDAKIIREHLGGEVNFSFFDCADNSVYDENDKNRNRLFNPKIVFDSLITIRKFINSNLDLFSKQADILVQDGREIKESKVHGYIEDHEVIISGSPFKVILKPIEVLQLGEKDAERLRKKLYDAAIDLREHLQSSLGIKYYESKDSWRPDWEKYKKKSLEELKQEFMMYFKNDEYNNKILSIEQKSMLNSKRFEMYKGLNDNGNPINKTIIEQKTIIQRFNPKEYNEILDSMIEVTKYAIKNNLHIYTHLW